MTSDSRFKEKIPDNPFTGFGIFAFNQGGKFSFLNIFFLKGQFLH
jgi:hypothetical protein